jgi:peptidoglycan L-alanyl-D-glutamate endopeptidase CwlK
MSEQLSKTEILYLQRTCAVCGLYNGPLDGKWTSNLADAEEVLARQGQELRDEFGLFDARTERNIATLMPPAQKVARLFMAAASKFPLAVRIISGSRTYAEQDALYAIGRTVETKRKPVTNAKGGRSNHNFGIAWDVGIFEADGRYMTGATKADNVAYADLGKFAKSEVKALEWGGDWKSFVDPPHYQLATGGKPIAQMQTLFEAGKSLFA